MLVDHAVASFKLQVSINYCKFSSHSQFNICVYILEYGTGVPSVSKTKIKAFVIRGSPHPPPVAAYVTLLYAYTSMCMYKLHES